MQPPILYCGWFVDVDDFRARAVARELARLRLNDCNGATPAMITAPGDKDDEMSDSDDEDDEDDDDVDHAERRASVQAAQDFRMCTALADAVMNDLGLRPHLNDYIVAVRGVTPGVPKSCIRLAFALYNNYDVAARPNEADICRVQDALGFQGEPMWFLDALETYWVYDQ